ncbi:hypothetical protein PILCRDRAFT_813517 [Piloderma croceum F 1598]|uniref:Protein RRP5 homolog n=1 Tax=Piloderma croceum (strain F 1598) TaxID=765440 RepID=A0A0C3CFP6_PILCF|nr:hypothetical protein PILCRDRAFT_813517 [Piloderma croceum F 1598]
MPKRVLDEGSSTHRAKKVKLADKDKNSKAKEQLIEAPSKLTTEEVDFPRGGGSSFTPIEVKAIRAEALREADSELFEDVKQLKTKKRKSGALSKAATNTPVDKRDQIRVEHLNYKRMTVGMKILGQIMSVQPLALIVSLPNQLFGHVPITQISTHLTHLLEAMDENEEPSEAESDDEQKQKSIPDLFEIFRPGQYVRAVITTIHAAGTTNVTGIGRTRDETVKASRRVELSLSPDKVNDGVQKSDLRPGFTLSAAVKSIEDHGYVLDLGIQDVSGFLSFKEAEKGPFDHQSKLFVGRLIDVSVTKMSGNGRTCTVTVDSVTFTASSLSEITNITSLLPGMLVQSLITAVVPSGLNLQILGYFEGTVDQIHLQPGKKYKIGQKIKARILYDISGTTPSKFALALVDHIALMDVRRAKAAEKSTDCPILQEVYSVGTILNEARVTRVEQERGLILEVEPGVEGFVHISHVSDDHVPSLSPSSGAWKVDTIHKARVIGYFAFDGLLHLSLRPSILEQNFFQVSDVQVGELVKGTIKKLAESGLFVSLSGNVDGVVWPNHYADIALKHPSKRFKAGASIKCRVLTVDSERKRIALTAKKTLIESSLPILSRFEDARVGLVTHAAVFKVIDKGLQIEFYNGLKAFIPAREASESTSGKLSDAFPIGKVLKVRIINMNPETSNIVASVRQAASNFNHAITDISSVEIGNTVEGIVSEIHKDHAIVTLQPTQVRALMSLINLANHRGLSLPQLRISLKAGDKVEQVFVVSRNPEKGFVIVAGKPKKSVVVPKGPLSIETIEIGQIVGGRVTRHGRNGAHVKITTRISGSLHPTDACDNYDAGMPFPAIDSILKAVVVDVDRQRGHLTLSTRPSKLYPEQEKSVVDREIALVDLHAGDPVRGFIRSVAEHGLFVMLGREIDARVQIKELFDEYVKNWKGHFEANQLVKGRILSVDREQKKVEMTFRSGDLERGKSSSLSLADLHEGQKVDGRIKRVEAYGLFIEIEGSKLSGLCHKSELSDNRDADVTVALRSFQEGDRVKVVILSIDKEKRQMSLGLKPSYFADEDFAAHEDNSDGQEEPRERFGVVHEKNDEDMADAVVRDPSGSEDEGSEDDEADQIHVDATIQSHPFGHASPIHGPSKDSIVEPPVPSLKIAGGFQWSGNGAPSEEEVPLESSSDESENCEQTGRKKKRRRKEIEQDLTADMHSRTPASNADFERLLLGSPNSSYLWIQYMSFQLQLSEVEKARELGQRALKTINFREEQEKLNVWIGLLNLENVYGTDETMNTTFKEAARHNDSKTVHLRLASIFDQTEKHQKAEEQYKRTCKKFSQSSKVWTLFGEHYLRRAEVEEARKLLPRSLQSLEKRKHLKTISKFAQLEYKYGDPERGKTIFEGIVDSHPKRWDLWSIYMDMESGQSDIQTLRNLFDRVFILKMTSHKAKSFFKRWLDLEKRLGDEEGVAIVKQKAIEWTQKAVNSS